MQITGKVAIVTGAGAGIGAALARALVAAGASVVVADLNEASALAVAEEIGDKAAGAGGDVSDPAVIDGLIALAEERFGPVDIYFANAGTTAGLGLDTPDDQWDVALGVNVLAHVRAARVLVPRWLESGGGYFVSTASAAGLLTQLGSATYSVSKHAAVAFAEWLSVSYGDKGIAVSCLAPMGVNTALLNSGFDSGLEGASLAASAVTSAGAVLEPADVADLVLAAMAEERFLILPHPEVLGMFANKSKDYDRWIDGMRRYRSALEAGLSGH